MPCKFVSCLILLFVLSGCASFNDLDFDKPLIPIPEKQEAKPKEEEVWIEAKTSRIWVNTHVDENGDYVEGHYKYTVLEPGHWMINGKRTEQQ